MYKGKFLSDPKGLIFESYNIEGIQEAECRSIFLDWALGLDTKFNAIEEISKYVSHYEVKYPDHPMNSVLREGLNVRPRRSLRRGNKK